MDDAIRRALVSLKGLSVGDALGESFFGPPRSAATRIRSRTLPRPVRRYTDDTQMAISVTDSLMTHGHIDQDFLAERFASRLESNRGYGLGALGILNAIRMGYDWRLVARQAFGGQGSFGNGAAMRVAPVGAYFGSDREAVVQNAILSAEITHTHPEGIAGAIAVALSASFAATLNETYGMNEKPDGGLPQRQSDESAFFDWVLQSTPAGATKEGIVRATTIPLSSSPTEAARVLGSGQNISAQDTVPFVLWSAAGNLISFEEAFWRTVEGLGDRDTTCAIVGGIVSLSTEKPIPARWFDLTEKLPQGFEPHF